MKREFVVVLVAVAVALPALAVDEGDLRILTSPIGLVVGEQPIEVDLGSSGEPAELYLDGQPACSLIATLPRCTVDLGEAPHLHLLELIRFDASRRTLARAERWVNRPGREAGLRIDFLGRNPNGVCGGRVFWAHPLDQDPAVLEVVVDGQRWNVSDDGHTFGFSCPDPDLHQVVAASAIFPDGRCAEAAILSGRTDGSSGTDVLAVPLLPTDHAVASCQELIGKPVRHLGWAEQAGLEVAIVLDPSADYNALGSLGRSSNGLEGRGSNPADAWQRATSSLSSADRLSFVMPDRALSRVDGFTRGRTGWLGLVFNFGSTNSGERPRIADAVATAGMVAGAGPRRRAVVLVLGESSKKDASRITPTAARAYLAEIGVPLAVFRTGAAVEDGWPEGVRVSSLGSFADSLTTLKDRVDAQCMAWIPADLHPNQIASFVPEGVVVAGRDAGARKGVESVWRRAEIGEIAPSVRLVSGEAVASERVEVTAVTVLVSARDARGGPVVDLTPHEIEVTEDGRLVPVLGVQPVPHLQQMPQQAAAEIGDEAPSAPAALPAANDVPVAVYVESQLSGSTDLAPALAALAERAEWLVTMGPVDVVVADRDVEVILDNERDVAVVRDTLARLAAEPAGGHAIERIRARYLRDIRKYPDRGGVDGESVVTSMPNNIERIRIMTMARSAIFEEDSLLRGAVARMNDWALAEPAAGPRLLMVVGAGFDMDPNSFYLPFISQNQPSLAPAARAEFSRYHQGARVEAVGRELAAAGWRVIPVAARVTGKSRISAEFGGGDRFQAFLSTGSDEGAYASDVDWLMLDPIGSQQRLARPSGGKVVMSGQGLDDLREESTGWYRLTYQVARAPDGAFHEVTFVSSRPGVRIEGSDVVVSGTSEGRAERRLRRLLAGSGERGELSVELTTGKPKPVDDNKMAVDLTVTVGFEPIAPLFTKDGKRVIRFSVAVRAGKGELFVHHQLATATGVLGGMHLDIPLQWHRGDAELAVVAEDLGSGAWGGTVQELVD